MDKIEWSDFSFFIEVLMTGIERFGASSSHKFHLLLFWIFKLRCQTAFLARSGAPFGFFTGRQEKSFATRGAFTRPCFSLRFHETSFPLQDLTEYFKHIRDISLHLEWTELNGQTFSFFIEVLCDRLRGLVRLLATSSICYCFGFSN